MRTLSSAGILLASISTMIGSGWLFGPLFAAQMAGPASLVSWALGGLLIFIIAMTFAEVTTALPVTGASTMHSHFTHGKLFGFTVGWILWASLVFSIPLEIQAALHYSSHYFPELLKKDPQGLELSGTGLVVALLVMVLLSTINAYSIKAMSQTNTWVTVWKLLVPAGIAVLYLAHPKADFLNLTQGPGGFNPYGWHGILAATATGGIVYSFTGFQFGLMLAGEVKNPQKSVPRSAIASICSCLILYLLLQLAFLATVPKDSLSGGWSALSLEGLGGPLASIGIMLGLHWVVHFLQVDAALSPTGSALVQTASASRIVYSMGIHGTLPKWFSWLNKGRVPVRAIGLNLLVGSLVFFPLFNLKNLFALLSTVEILTFVPGPVCLYAFRTHQPTLDRPFSLAYPRVWAHIGFMVCSLLLYWSGFSTIWKVTVVVMAGVLTFFITLKLKHKETSLVLKKANLDNSLWFFVYLFGMGVISLCGTFEGGKSWLAFPFDLLVIAGFSHFILNLSAKKALPKEEMEAYLKTACSANGKV